jgi:ferric-dicitrate binding protein FerR (iron transport regulator)
LEDIIESGTRARLWEELAEYEKNGKAVEVERVEETAEKVLTAEERQAKIRAFIAEERAMEAEERQLAELKRHRIRERELRRRQRAKKAQSVAAKVRRYLRNSAMAAMLMVIGYFVYIITQPVPSAFVATLSDGIDVKWSDPRQPLELGSVLRPGIFKLVAGYARITFDEGARIIVEAPAEIELESENRAFVQTGKVSAEVPTEAQSFTINTPSASMVDLGTEFCVYVQEDGTSDLHVFKGKVALVAGPIGKKTNDLNANGAKEQIVRTGQAKRVAADSSEIEDIRFGQTAFVRNIPSPYELAVRRSRPRGYWRFGRENLNKCDNSIDSARNVAKYVGSTAFDENGPGLGDGKSNDALKLNGRPDNYMIIENIASGRLQRGGLSLVLWLRADKIAEQSILTNETKTGQASWFSRYFLMEENGQFVFIVYFDDDRMYEGRPVETCLIRSEQLAQKGRWYHLAVTLSQNHVRMFIDGRLEAEAREPIEQFSNADLLWYLCTGADIEPTDGDDAPPINGAIDELAIYDRALSPEEIRQLYLASQQ